jgi:2-polyprenyl-6-methoxyphenol 4-hydroxylase
MFDLLIAGGGMVGLSLAALLPSSLRICVVDRFPMPTESTPLPQPSFDGRSTALSFNSMQILKATGVWESIAPIAEPIQSVHVSQREHLGSTLMTAKEKGWEALGCVVENAWLGRSLLELVRQKNNVILACPKQVTKLTPQLDHVKAELLGAEDQIDVVKAKLAVIADGAGSNLCQQLGIGMQTENYHHSAIVANVAIENAHLGVAYERFTQDGPLALLPLSTIKSQELQAQHRSALIWTLPAAKAEEVLSLDDEEFLGCLQSQFGGRLGRLMKVGKRQSYPLVLSTAKEQIRKHLVVLGNAAHTLHPVAGQGFNLALRDCFALCKAIEWARENDYALGDLGVLSAYEQQQKIDQDMTRWFSDKLPAWFSRQNIPTHLISRLGFLSLTLMPEVKGQLIDFAAGCRNP